MIKSERSGKVNEDNLREYYQQLETIVSLLFSLPIVLLHVWYLNQFIPDLIQIGVGASGAAVTLDVA
ncbi:hypothetical protein AgCh_022003 [Apium graveolens]